MRATKSAGNGCQVEQVNESGGIIVNRELPVDVPVMTKTPRLKERPEWER